MKDLSTRLDAAARVSATGPLAAPEAAADVCIAPAPVMEASVGMQGEQFAFVEAPAHTAAPSAVTFGQPAAVQASLADFSPQPGRYSVSDDSSLVNIRGISVGTGGQASADHLRFSVTASGSALGSDFNQTLTVDVRRTSGDQVRVSVGGRSFEGTMRINADGSMTVTNNHKAHTGDPVQITIGRGGRSFNVEIEKPLSNIHVHANHA